MSSSASPELSLKDKLYAYAQLMRIDRPIGTLATVMANTLGALVGQ